MGLDAVWQQCAYIVYQVWVWLRYEASVHPILYVGAVIVIVLAVIMYRTEVKGK
jgi:hypothetical protein